MDGSDAGTMADDRAERLTWSPARLAEEGVAYRVVNVLANGCIRSPIDIQKLALLVRNADYTPRGFNALIMRFQSPRATLLAYQSGKFVVVGVKSTQEAHAAADKFVSILKKVSFPSRCTRFNIANVVGSSDMGFRVRLEGLAREHARFCTYEPELFPGLIYRMLEPKCTLLIFVSGKIVITGSKTTTEGEDALCKIFPVLLQFRVREDSSDEEDDEDDEIDEDDGLDAWP